jgi:CoA:oxalate CoA-transferase
VIKTEQPDGGDRCRQLPISNLRLDNDSTLFQSINRTRIRPRAGHRVDFT